MLQQNFKELKSLEKVERGKRYFCSFDLLLEQMMLLSERKDKKEKVSKKNFLSRKNLRKMTH